MEAQARHPILPVSIRGKVFKAPKLAPLTSIVNNIPDMPFTGKLLTKIEMIKDLKMSNP